MSARLPAGGHEGLNRRGPTKIKVKTKNRKRPRKSLSQETVRHTA